MITNKTTKQELLNSFNELLQSWVNLNKTNKGFKSWFKKEFERAI